MRHGKLREVVGARHAVIVDAGVEAAVRAVAVDENAGILRAVVEFSVAHGAYFFRRVARDRPAYLDAVRPLCGGIREGDPAVCRVGRPAVEFVSRSC